LLQDDQEWEACITEAASVRFPEQLRRLFVVILHFGEATDPGKLWLTFRKDLTEDFRRDKTEPEADNLALWEIEYQLNDYGMTLSKFSGMPLPVAVSASTQARIIQDELAYDVAALKHTVEKNIKLFLPAQKQVFDTIMTARAEKWDGTPHMFFVDA
jgi:hypothetical protein